jgi:hypothetical protein
MNHASCDNKIVKQHTVFRLLTPPRRRPLKLSWCPLSASPDPDMTAPLHHTTASIRPANLPPRQHIIMASHPLSNLQYVNSWEQACINMYFVAISKYSMVQICFNKEASISSTNPKKRRVAVKASN